MFPSLKILIELRRGKRIYIKALTVRFGFDVQRTSQLQKICQKPSNGKRPIGVLYPDNPCPSQGHGGWA